MFKLIKTDKKTKARRGVITTDHGDIQSPFFMPVGTTSTVKSLTFEDLNEFNAQIVLSNTYHLYLRPQMEVIEAAGGLHAFTGWNGPILTDSGGYQVFSLTKLRKLTDDGVEFQSHLDGSKHFFTPEKVVDIERTLGSDMMMPLDECSPYPCSEKQAEEAVVRTTQWARRSKEHFQKTKPFAHKQFLFGIVQGATYQHLRERSAKEIMDIGFDAYAIGGVSVGETVKEMFSALDWVIPLLPQDKPRYFMGIGLPDQMVKAVGEGIDMFDTCLPTRYGRHGTAFTRRGQIILKNAAFKKDFSPIDESCACTVCRKYTKAYIRHLVSLNELTALRLISYHNVHFYVNLMNEIRRAIDEDRYEEFSNQFIKDYGSDIHHATL